MPELAGQLREILGLEREWRVIIVGAGKVGTALAQYGGFSERGFHIVAVYDQDPAKIGTPWEGLTVRDVAEMPGDTAQERPDIAVLTVPADAAQGVVDRLVAAGVPAILNFAPAPIHVPADVALKNVNMALELEGLAYALTNRDVTDGAGSHR